MEWNIQNWPCQSGIVEAVIESDSVIKWLVINFWCYHGTFTVSLIRIVQFSDLVCTVLRSGLYCTKIWSVQFSDMVCTNSRSGLYSSQAWSILYGKYIVWEVVVFILPWCRDMFQHWVILHLYDGARRPAAEEYFTKHYNGWSIAGTGAGASCWLEGVSVTQKLIKSIFPHYTLSSNFETAKISHQFNEHKFAGTQLISKGSMSNL